MKRLLSCLFGSIVLWSSSSALAQDFGKKGQFAVAGERLFGVGYHKFTVTRETPTGDRDTRTTGTTVSLIGQGLTNPAILQLPRVGFDYFIIDGLTIGGSLVYSTTSAEVEAELDNGRQNDTDLSFNTFIIAPRVGYALMFSDVFGIWPRGGITYARRAIEDNDGDETHDSLWAFSAEVPLIISPIPHVGFLVAPGLDWGFAGTREFDPNNPNQPEVEQDIKSFELGVYAGLFVYF